MEKGKFIKAIIYNAYKIQLYLSIEGRTSNSRDVCAKACVNRAGCNYFNFYQATSTCLMYSATDGARENPNAQSGKISNRCGTKFHPLFIESKISFVISHYADGFHIVPIAPITAASMSHLLDIDSMMGPLGGTSDYWIDRKALITNSFQTLKSSHYVFELTWTNFIRIFESKIVSDPTTFAEAQIKFVNEAIQEHAKFIEKNIESRLKKDGTFSIESFYDRLITIETSAECAYNGDSLTCSCDEGFESNGIECIDQNECFDFPNCLGLGCYNFPGGHKCVEQNASSCPEGFVGQFPNCVDINECELDENICPDGRICNNTIGSYQCSCPGGFGDGFSFACAKMSQDVCLNTICGENATCSIQNGNEICHCDQGYFGDGFVCGEIDECRAQEAHNKPLIWFTTISDGWMRFR